MAAVRRGAPANSPAGIGISPDCSRRPRAAYYRVAHESDVGGAGGAGVGFRDHVDGGRIGPVAAGLHLHATCVSGEWETGPENPTPAPPAPPASPTSAP